MMGGDDPSWQQSSSNQNVIIPDTGAAKYWYVDPRATPVAKPKPDDLTALADALDRIGVVPQGQTGF